MKGWRRSLVMLVVVATLLPTLAMARKSQEDYEWKTWRTRRSHAGFNGFGGFFFSGQVYESDAFSTLATRMGVSGIKDNLTGFGGWGMAHLGNGWRIGGLGYGYMTKGTGVFTDPETGDRYNRRLQLDVGGGGFMIEYSPWMIGPVNFGVGSLLGWGGAVLTMHQDSGAFTWADLGDQYVNSASTGENISTEILQNFMLAEPYVTARVHLLDWMAFTATVGYHFDSLQSSNWQFANNDLSGQGPDLNMNQLFFRAGLVFGG
ncbi:MAG: hypothetical protein V2A56_06000 [bacterium]